MDSSLLKSLLECPVCLTVPSPPDHVIFLCKNSHKICQPCHLLLPRPTCPQGDCSYEAPPLRNRDLENIIQQSNIQFCCRFWRKGCQVEELRLSLSSHEAECDYRDVTCPLNCGDLVRLREMDRHVKQEHRSTAFKGRGESLSISWNLKESHFTSDMRIFAPCLWENLEGERFYCSLEKYGEIWVAWIQVEGGELAASKWNSRIKIDSKQTSDVIDFTGEVMSIDKIKSDIIFDTKACFSMTNEEVRKLKGTELTNEQKKEGYWGKLTIKFHVEERKDENDNLTNKT